MLISLLAFGSLFVNDYFALDRERDKQMRDKATKKYWDACNFPRKQKKRMRKEAMIDIALFSM